MNRILFALTLGLTACDTRKDREDETIGMLQRITDVQVNQQEVLARLVRRANSSPAVTSAAPSAPASATATAISSPPAVTTAAAPAPMPVPSGLAAYPYDTGNDRLRTIVVETPPCPTCSDSGAGKDIDMTRVKQPQMSLWEQFWAYAWNWCTVGNLLKVLVPLMVVILLVRSNRRALATARGHLATARDHLVACLVNDPQGQHEATRRARAAADEAEAEVNRVAWYGRHMPVGASVAVPAIQQRPNPAVPVAQLPPGGQQ